MLVLTRKSGRSAGQESEVMILVPGMKRPIVVKLLSASRGEARIGVDCDRTVEIWRGEIYDPQRTGGPNKSTNGEIDGPQSKTA